MLQPVLRSPQVWPYVAVLVHSRNQLYHDRLVIVKGNPGTGSLESSYLVLVLVAEFALGFSFHISQKYTSSSG